VGKLIWLYDDNHGSLEVPTSWAVTESVPQRFEAYGWHVLRLPDGNDLSAIGTALEVARAETDRPSLLCIRTHLGYGSPVQDTRQAHGDALGPVNLRATKDKLGWPQEPTFYVPPEARTHLREALDRGKVWQTEWERLRTEYGERFPDDGRRFDAQMRGELPAGWDSGIPTFRADEPGLATRDASQKILDALAPRLPALAGGAADLSPSTKTLLPGSADFSASDPEGRNFHFGVREHAMVGVLNGMALHGGLIPYGATFLIFSDYARGALRLAALQQTHTIFIFTHDSIALGEDGPTHQPIEQLLSLRAIPGFNVVRPADANETAAAWRLAIRRPGPTALVFTRQKLPTLDPSTHPIADGVPRGGYILSESAAGEPKVVFLATGSEVALAMAAQETLRSRGIGARVVSLPSWRLFDEQSSSYRESVLLAGVPRVSVEAGVTLGWERYVGSGGESLGVDRFGASAPGPVVQRELGLTVERVVQAAERVMRARPAGKVP
jgi:transketolase